MSGQLQPGERFLGRYLVESLIAEGGMAAIYRATDSATGVRVAIKNLYPYYADNPVIRTRFLEEGRIQQFLAHPNIVRVHRIVEGPRLSIVMEHVDGPTLDEYLLRIGPLPEPSVLDLIIPVMSAVGFAHSRGVIHRDIKPSNILVAQPEGARVPKVMDFGVAKIKDGEHDLTATGTTVGTLHYMSPEQIVGAKNIDGRADIYSLGVTLYKLMTGEVPFNAPTEFALMMAQVEASPLPPRKLRRDLSPQLEAIILRAMEKRPEARFQSIREFTSALLDMRDVVTSASLRDTLTERIDAEILDFAMAADEVAHDRTGELILGGVDISEQPTGELDSPILRRGAERFDRKRLEEKADEPPLFDLGEDRFVSSVEPPSAPDDPTDKMRHSRIFRRLEGEPAEAAADAIDDASTVLIPSLKRRLSDVAPELDGLDREDPTFRDDDVEQETRPSRPSATGDGFEDKTTESLLRRDAVDVRASVVLDADAGSRDMTAPKLNIPHFDARPLSSSTGLIPDAGSQDSTRQWTGGEAAALRQGAAQPEPRPPQPPARREESWERQVPPRQAQQTDVSITRPAKPASSPLRDIALRFLLALALAAVALAAAWLFLGR